MKTSIKIDVERFKRELESNALVTAKTKADMLDAGNKFVEGQAKINHRPNRDTGTLSTSIKAQAPVVSGREAYAEVHVGAEYAMYVEYGTYRSRAFPFLRPAVLDHKSTIEALMGQVLQWWLK